jgi:hypothetical protein
MVDNIKKIINEEIINEYLTNNEVSLMKYFSQSDEEKKQNLPFSYNYEYLFNEFVEEKDIDYDINNDFDDIPSEYFNEYAEWLFNKIEGDSLNVDPSEYPAWAYLSSPKLIKNQWLIHFTDDADGISNNGFIYGVNDIEKLGLTTHLSDFDKKYGGYNFSYLLSDFVKYGQSNRGWSQEYKYGKEAVIFNASGVKLYHGGDEEPQVIFYGNTATNIIPITNGENSRFAIYSKISERVLYESDDLEYLIKWLITNFNQYRKQLFSK